MLATAVVRQTVLLVILAAALSLVVAQDSEGDKEVVALREQLLEAQARASAAEQEVASLRDQRSRLVEKDAELQAALAEQQRAAHEVRAETERSGPGEFNRC